MTVLLIDSSGHVQEREISELVTEIRIALPRHYADLWNDDPPRRVEQPTAVFVYSDECSFPPVYRQRLTKWHPAS